MVSVQETKVGRSQLEEVDMDFEQYEGAFSSAEKKGYSGVATYARTPLGLPKSKYGIGRLEYDREGRFLISDFGDFLLYNIYFPSGTTGAERQEYKYRFLDDFLAYLKRRPKAERARTILCGDFNICHKPIDIHHPKVAEKRELSGFLPEERAWMDKLEQAGFVDAFRYQHGDISEQYTWWSYRAATRQKNLGWRIDYFWVAESLSNRIQNTQIHANIPGSDHCPVSLTLK